MKIEEKGIGAIPQQAEKRDLLANGTACHFSVNNEKKGGF